MNVLNADAPCNQCGCYIYCTVDGDNKTEIKTGFVYNVIGEVFCPDCGNKIYNILEPFPFMMFLPNVGYSMFCEEFDN